MNVNAKSERESVSTDTLGARIFGLRKARGMSQGDFGKAFGVSQVAVSRWEKNLDRPGLKILTQMGEFLDGAESRRNFLEMAGIQFATALVEGGPAVRTIKLLRDAVAAGTPRVTDEREVEALLPLPKEWFKPGGELYALKVTGDSMAPLIHSGYIVIVDTSERNPRKLVQHMVAAREGDGVTIKWLRQDGDAFLLVPQHTSIDHPVRIMRPDGDFSIVGRVVRLIGEPPPIRKGSGL